MNVDYSFTAAEIVMMVRGRGEIMQGKNCLFSWEILLVKIISVNLMKIF